MLHKRLYQQYVTGIILSLFRNLWSVYINSVDCIRYRQAHTFTCMPMRVCREGKIIRSAISGWLNNSVLFVVFGHHKSSKQSSIQHRFCEYLVPVKLILRKKIIRKALFVKHIAYVTIHVTKYSQCRRCSSGNAAKLTLFCGEIIQSIPHFLVLFTVKPFFNKEPSDLTVLAGQTVQFYCSVGGDPMPQILWRKDDGSMPVGR